MRQPLGQYALGARYLSASDAYGLTEGARKGFEASFYDVMAVGARYLAQMDTAACIIAEATKKFRH